MIPHYLQPQGPAFPDSFSNSFIRPGEVVDVVYPEDSRSIGRRLVEYRVQVQHRDQGTDAGGAREYRCTMANWLCGFTDRSRLLLRSDTPGKDGVGKGSKVLVACLSGEHNAGIILCGLRDDRDSDRGLKDAKVAWDWEVNGLRAELKLDGTVTLLRGGPKNLDGKVTQSPKTLGSLSISDDGSVQAGLQPDADQAPTQYLRLDAASGQVKVVSDSGLRVGKANEAFVLGTTYRKQQKKMDQDLSTAVQQAQAAAQASAVALAGMSTAILTPTTGAVACSPFLTTLATQLGLLAAALGRMQVAVQTFESGSSSYLSTRNLGD